MNNQEAAVECFVRGKHTGTGEVGDANTQKSIEEERFHPHQLSSLSPPRKHQGQHRDLLVIWSRPETMSEDFISISFNCKSLPPFDSLSGDENGEDNAYLDEKGKKRKLEWGGEEKHESKIKAHFSSAIRQRQTPWSPGRVLPGVSDLLNFLGHYLNYFCRKHCCDECTKRDRPCFTRLGHHCQSINGNATWGDRVQLPAQCVDQTYSQYI